MNPDSRNMLCALSEEGAEFLLVGAHLLRNKKAVGRPKDQADVAWSEAGEP